MVASSRLAQRPAARPAGLRLGLAAAGARQGPARAATCRAGAASSRRALLPALIAGSSAIAGAAGAARADEAGTGADVASSRMSYSR